MRTVWEGKIKLVEFVRGRDRIARWDPEEFDFDELKEVLKRIKREAGEGTAWLMLYSLAGLLEEAKLRVIFLQSEIFDEGGEDEEEESD